MAKTIAELATAYVEAQRAFDKASQELSLYVKAATDRGDRDELVQLYHDLPGGFTKAAIGDYVRQKGWLKS